LIQDLEQIKSLPLLKGVPEGGGIQKSINKLLDNRDNRNFILNADNSSLINSIIINRKKEDIKTLEKEIETFLLE
jgi:hypothetical protein